MRSSKKTQKKERGLNIIIVGCGKVGSTLVEKLSKESHDITVIDQKNEVIQRITEDYDVMGFTGNGASYSIQIEAGIQDADVLIAVTESDELNLLSCTIAKRSVTVLPSHVSGTRITVWSFRIFEISLDFR